MAACKIPFWLMLKSVFIIRGKTISCRRCRLHRRVPIVPGPAAKLKHWFKH